MSELYKEAAELLQKLERREGGLKSLAYADNVQHKRSSFALVCETLRFKPLLLQLLAAVPEFKLQKKLKGGAQRALLLISLYDLLFGRQQKIQGGGHMKKELMQCANAFKAALVRLKVRAKVASNEALLPKENRKSELMLPRYVRVNTLLIADDELAAFRTEFPDAVDDAHVADLLVLPSGTELHDHPLVKAGKLILQDKASCFPAFVLHGERTDVIGQEGDVIDACAAPGNKTSHVAMLLHQRMAQQQQQTERTRKVFAFDRSAKRLDLLRRRMKLAGADELVEPCLQSFLDVDTTDAKYKNVRAILLDPSCSGSGMTNRLDHLLDIASSQDKADQGEHENDVTDGDTAARLQSLADFQLEALLKAFSFSQVERVSYSTCSIFQKENEDVVLAALTSTQNRNDPRPFQLRKCLPTWPRRGVAVEGLSAEQSDALVRADGHEDNTNGFFVAYFERQLPSSAPTRPDPRDSSEDEADNQTEPNSTGSGKRKLSEAQRESRKRRKREKLKQKKRQQQDEQRNEQP